MAKTLQEVQVRESGGGVLDNNNNNPESNNHLHDSHGNNKVVLAKCGEIKLENNNNTNSNKRIKLEEQCSPNANNECQLRKPPEGKYQLRPRLVHSRRHSDSDWNFPETTPIRHKRPQPLSRYRRKTANARERYRMRQINSAFENLRGVLPSWVCSRRQASDMTKISTLRLASAYIRSLQDILDGKAHHETCSWVLSAILKDTPNTKQSQPIIQEPSSEKYQTAEAPSPSDAELVSLLCPSDSMEFQDNLDSLTYLTPMAETEAMALLLGTDPPTPWTDTSQVSLV